MASFREDCHPWHSSTATLCDRRDWAGAALLESVTDADADFRNSLRASAATHRRFEKLGLRKGLPSACGASQGSDNNDVETQNRSDSAPTIGPVGSLPTS